MAEPSLTGIRVAILATDGFEQVELTEPRKALDRPAPPPRWSRPSGQGARLEVQGMGR